MGALRYDATLSGRHNASQRHAVAAQRVAALGRCSSSCGASVAEHSRGYHGCVAVCSQWPAATGSHDGGVLRQDAHVRRVRRLAGSAAKASCKAPIAPFIMIHIFIQTAAVR